MKRCAIARDVMATHEAGHAMVIAALPGFRPAELIWHRLASYEIAHAEPRYSRHFDWELTEDRNALIASRAALALAGGAAESCRSKSASAGAFSMEEVYDYVGRIDFELAHEWVTLQRHDPDQHTIGLELQRLFQDVRRFLGDRARLEPMEELRTRIIDYLRHADEAGLDSVTITADQLWQDTERPARLEVRLRETLYQ